MSGDATNGEYDGEGGAEGQKEVRDPEGSVDQQVKKRIMNQRQQVSERHDAVFTQAPMEPEIDLSRAEQLIIWGNSVKSFLRTIEPLLSDDDISHSETFYKQIKLGSLTLVPPDTDGYAFSHIKQTDLSDAEFAHRIGLPPKQDPPKPVRKQFVGLKSLIEAQPVYSHQWRVCTDANGPPPEREYVYPEATQPVPKTIYRDAMRNADAFLHQAGIGVDTGTKGSDIIRNFDMSGEEPSATYGQAEYSGDPDL